MIMNPDEKAALLQHIEPSLIDGSFVKMSFGKYRGGDSEFKGLTVNLITTNEGDRLSFRFSYKTKEVVKNYEIDKGAALISEITGKDFLSATLFTTREDYSLDYSKKRIPTLHTRKPAFSTTLPREHNREKHRIVDPASEYFYLLGISSKEGRVHSDKYDKFKQVDKFIEIVDSLVASSELKDKNEISATDLGSGKSYITFALYDYFTNTKGINAKVKGIEQRKELADLSNKTAIQCRFNSLSFMEGKISDGDSDSSDIVTALHACDTATDDAIAFALKNNAGIILLAPCCQKYVRKRMLIPDDLKPVFGHGILEERLAVILTDSLRALVLEYFGYETKVFEFISSEHTSRNTMITGVRPRDTGKINMKALNEIKMIKEKFGVEDFYLDKILGLEKQ
jgi:hypothetical protein